MKKSKNARTIEPVERERERERERESYTLLNKYNEKIAGMNCRSCTLSGPETNKIKNVGAGLVSAHAITIITLIITIVILLILVGITIRLTIGENGIITMAQQAGENYTTAETTELEDLDYLIPLSMQITAENYGDYVNYPVNIGRGPDETAHKTDWRIFYKDDEGYVYLIASYLLLNSEMPEGTTMVGYTERPYTTYWGNEEPTYTEISSDVATRYKFNFRYNGSYNNDYTNMACVSELLDTSKWAKFALDGYAEDTIGSPTLEMWVASWNEKGYTRLYCDNSDRYGYYVGKESLEGKLTEEIMNIINASSGLSRSDSLYFPDKYNSNGISYWIASPSYGAANCLSYVGYFGDTCRIIDVRYGVRPVVCLKANITATQDEDGVWQLRTIEE
jgi:hypothetical protein